jgi:putative hydrolase of the HAD superfamily
MVDTIFFDWGGVLADDPGDGFLNKLLQQIGATDEQVQEIYTTYMRRFMRGELSEQEYWQALELSYGLEIKSNISDEFLAWEGLKVNDKVLNLVREAKAKNLTTAILSNVIEPTYTVLQRSGCYDLFDYVIASCKVGYAKPQSEIYDIALKTTSSSAERSLFIDDKQANLLPAQEMGFSTILAMNPVQIIRDTRKYL